MATETIAMTKIAHDMLVLHQRRETGELTITCRNQSLQWNLYFYLGRLVYATGGSHPVRRWLRALRYHCPGFFASGWLATAESQADLWEVDLLNQAAQQGQITAAQYKAVVQSIIQEVMFAIVEQRILVSEWHSGRQIAQRTAFLSVEQVIQSAQELRKAWRDAGLGSMQELLPQFSPDLAPVFRSRPQLETQISASTYKSLIRLMKGQLTLWDVALEMQRPLPAVIRALLPLIRRGVIELQASPDFTFSCQKTVELRPQPVTPSKGWIACIDDSPAIAEAIAQIVEPLGYRVLPITNPLQGISTLLEHNPVLIFLDLVMPNTNGYELCSFLRKTSAFQNTPIVILTGHDSVIDRVRAKLSGSSDFLAKPPDASKVVQTLHKHLGEAAAVMESNLGESSLPTDLATA
jgi:two-component system, chemotaxis family, response regulator PixG